MSIVLNSADATALILPELGGRIHQLSILRSGALEPLLWSPENTDEYRANPFAGGCFVMAPWPNRIAESRFMFRGNEFHVPANDGPHALHGLVADCPWQVVANTGRACELMVDFDERWPWRGRVWQRIELVPGALRLKLEVRCGGQSFPAGCGWHPWFRRAAFGASDVHVTVPADRVYQREGQIPAGPTVAPAGSLVLDGAVPLGGAALDDCFTTLTAAPSLLWGESVLALEFASPAPHVQVFVTANAVCIEPQTCAADAFNLAARSYPGTGFAIVEPGRPLSLTSTWRWS